MLLHSVPTAISHFGEHPSISLPDNCALSPLSLKETCRCSALFKVQLRMAQLTAKYLTSIQASDLVVLSLQHLCVPNEILFSRLRALWRKKKKKVGRAVRKKKETNRFGFSTLSDLSKHSWLISQIHGFTYLTKHEYLLYAFIVSSESGNLHFGSVLSLPVCELSQSSLVSCSVMSPACPACLLQSKVRCALITANSHLHLLISIIFSAVTLLLPWDAH